jgi:hypothetical protein
MSGYESNSTSPDEGTDHHDTAGNIQLSVSGPQLQRVADMVATGDLPVPLHLPDDQLAMLVREVRELRRQRLVQFIARAIAMHIVNGNGQGG